MTYRTANEALELMKAKRVLKNGKKTPDADIVTVDILKHGEPSATKSNIRMSENLDQRTLTPALDADDNDSSSEKCNTRLCQNYMTISLISRPSTIVLRVILSRLINQAEEILEEEQACFRSQRSTNH